MAMQSGHERCRLHSVSRVLRVRAVRARTPLVHARASNSPKQKTSRADALRKLLREPGIHQGPCCHDALSAKLIEDAGFPFAFMSGFAAAAATAALPDTGLMSYGEVVAVGRRLHEATGALPIIGDGDTGYGNAVNVKRTVRGFADAGFAGILIEDQQWPKSCGHVQNKAVVPRGEAVARVRAAVDARDAGADILIVARTDARQAESLEEALARAEAFAEAGADALFIDALQSEDEMRRFTSLRGLASGVLKMASLLEGGGKTPMVPLATLQRLGFKLVAYPLSLLGVSVAAMQGALRDLKAGEPPAADKMPTFAELQSVLGFPEYFAEAERYAVGPEDVAAGAAAPDTAGAAEAAAAETQSAGGAAAAAATTAAAVAAAAAAAATAPAESAGGTAAAAPTGSECGATAAEESQNDTDACGTGSSASSTAASCEEKANSAAASSTADGTGTTSGEDAGASRPVVEADSVIEPGQSKANAGAAADEVTTAVLVREPEAEAKDERPPIDLSRASVRVVVTETRTGKVKLETRIPSRFLDPLSMVVPQLAGTDLRQVIRKVTGSEYDPTVPIFTNQTSAEDTVRVYLEQDP